MAKKETASLVQTAGLSPLLAADALHQTDLFPASTPVSPLLEPDCGQYKSNDKLWQICAIIPQSPSHISYS